MPVEIVLQMVSCLRCGYRWPPRKNKLPAKCARCRSKYWNTPYSPNASRLQTNKKTPTPTDPSWGEMAQEVALTSEAGPFARYDRPTPSHTAHAPAPTRTPNSA